MALYERISNMATQDEVDALAEAVDQVTEDLSTSVSVIQSELDELAAQNPSVDFSTVKSKVSALDDAVKAVADLKPTVPVTPPEDDGV